MPKQIRLNAFGMVSPVHQSPGLWTHPDDRSLEYTTLDYWVDLARTLERGNFDSLFLADSLTSHDVYGGTADEAIRYGAQVPKHDPLLLISAMAYATRDLGFAVTGNITYEHPYLWARKMSTLDHLTNGRVGWNIVTGHAASSVKALGNARVPPRDARYQLADEYMEVVYKLWEGSWEDGALLRDKTTGVFADPRKVHRIEHTSANFSVEGIHLTEPSPQRTPLLFQAGASTSGRTFAAKHAECIFISGPTPSVIAPIVGDTRRRAVENGRNADDILFFAMATVITAPTDAEAHEKLREFEKYINTQAAIVLFSGWTGIDFSKYAPTDPVKYVAQDIGIASALQVFTTADPDRVWTVGELARHNAIGGRGPVIVGSPATVADELEAWMSAADVDGFNLSYAITPGGYIDFVDLVVPELQRRGRYKTAYAPGTLREKLQVAGGSTLQSSHPGATYRAPPRK